ncbi:Tricarboxylate/iron carrier [Ascodesmis nigricans]|uniref:Tricarboxylate/iron carrier n=1 Tax=Ascodesmis nigricans TaxID=341454 RepID=A0A4S2N624_9PEZI|nr:Tricarboxylate/iron carrier [Ascodesmis nigricans]
MSSSIPGPRDLPASRHDLSTYWGRVKHSADLCDPRTLFASSTALASATTLIQTYRNSPTPTAFTPSHWNAKKILDATLHPDTGLPVFLPFRMSCFIFSNLIVTAGMLQPNLTTRGVLAWQITNQTLNVAINSANANKSSPPSWTQMGTSFVLAVGASCGVALGLGRAVDRLKNVKPNTKVLLGRLVPFAAVCSAGIVNVGLMRGGEILAGIDVFRKVPSEKSGDAVTENLGKSRIAAAIAVGETAVSRVLNAAPIMVVPPIVLMALQKRGLKNKFVIPANIGLIFATSVFALPLALGAFPQRQKISPERLEEKFHGKGGVGGVVEFNRGI